MKDGLHYSAITSKNGLAIEKYSYASGESVGVIVSAKEIKEKTGQQINFDAYEFSANEDKVLLATKTESIYRHSSYSKFSSFIIITN